MIAHFLAVSSLGLGLGWAGCGRAGCVGMCRFLRRLAEYFEVELRDRDLGPQVQAEADPAGPACVRIGAIAVLGLLRLLEADRAALHANRNAMSLRRFEPGRLVELDRVVPLVGPVAEEEIEL